MQTRSEGEPKGGCRRARPRPASGRRLCAAILVALALAASGAADTDDPWSVLTSLRDRLSATPQSADFVQTFQPAGFSSSEREEGQMHLSLPSCLRWDYTTPYAKSFLLCESTVYSWNPGETTGRRVQLDSGSEPGLDLLRLRVEELQTRYEARVQTSTEDSIEVVLIPTSEDRLLAEARITVDPTANRLLALAYEDLEGNATRFEISGYRSLETPVELLPPDDLEWIDE